MDTETGKKHAKRRQLKNKLRATRTIDKMKGIRLTKRGPINVPLVLAAIEEDVVDALGPVKILGSRLPRVMQSSAPEASEKLEHQHWEDEQAKQRWLSQYPYGDISAA